LANSQYYILDQQFQPVPIGAVGELYIGGEGLAVGYWKRPELTVERFVPNPFRPEERLYRTGDLAYYLPDGNVICLGRIDHQVKVHGVRVELGEIETALRGLKGVRDAVVVSWVDAHENNRLVAHILSTVDDHPAPAELRAYLRERLPEVMIPSHFLFTDTFPLTASGKVLRTALPSPQEIKPTAAAKKPAPTTPTERLLAEAWAGVLEIDQSIIGREDDFLDLGGHSLLMTPLMLEVRKLFQVSFHMRDFFNASTIQKFAALIDERRRARPAGASNGHRPVPTRSVEWGRERMAFLRREAQLPPTVAPARGMVYRYKPGIRSVFLTGSTGFLGAYIVREILETTEAELHCLVRPKRDQSGKERIERQMRHHKVWRDDEAWQTAWNRRVHIVEGDVTLPRMGIPDPIYEPLAREVDGIIHSAAHVNFIYPYEALRATNVLGVHEIIRFAFHSRIKQVHHLSTAAIWPMGAQYTFYEKDSIEHGGVLNLGYDEAKWVGERCLLNAAERGLPVARYRPGEVGGDSLTGNCITDHFLIAAIKGFLQFGAFPDLDMEVDVAPVDYVAKALIHLVFHKNPLGRAFHLTNPERRHMSEALTFLRSLGYRFDELRFEDLRDRLVHDGNFGRNALFPYQATLEDMDDISMQLPNYDTTETRRELEGSGIVCPPADEQLFATYMSYLRETGFIPAPDEIAAGLPVAA
jgi:thioester reductase-like protein